jgi:hypothetical protein
VRIWHGHAGAKALTARKEAITNLIPQNLIVLALFAAAALVAGFFAYIYSIKRQTYLLIWTIGWAVYSLHFLGGPVALGSPGPFRNPAQSLAVRASSMLFFIGAQLYSNRKPWIMPAGVAAGVPASGPSPTSALPARFGGRSLRLSFPGPWRHF